MKTNNAMAFQINLVINSSAPTDNTLVKINEHDR